MTPERFEELKQKASSELGLTRLEVHGVIAELARLREREPVAWITRDADGEPGVWTGRQPKWVVAAGAWNNHVEGGGQLSLTGFHASALCRGVKPGECRPLYAGDPISPPKPPLEPVYSDDAMTVYRLGKYIAIVMMFRGQWLCWPMPSDPAYETRAEAEAEAAAWCQQGGD